MCQIWFIFKIKWFIYYFCKRRRSETKVLLLYINTSLQIKVKKQILNKNSCEQTTIHNNQHVCQLIITILHLHVFSIISAFLKLNLLYFIKIKYKSFEVFLISRLFLTTVLQRYIFNTLMHLWVYMTQRIKLLQLILKINDKGKLADGMKEQSLQQNQQVFFHYFPFCRSIKL